jgi:hypothetical protein
LSLELLLDEADPLFSPLLPDEDASLLLLLEPFPEEPEPLA